MQQMQVKDRRSGTHTIIPLDLGDLTTIRPFVEEFAKLNLPLCYLINNAGIMSPKFFFGFFTTIATVPHVNLWRGL